jgi:Flp pilus assembly protein TadG
VLPLLLVALVGVVEVTTLFVHYVSVVNASRDGARIGSKGSATDAEIRSLAANDLAKLPGGITATADVKISRTPVPGDTAISVEACYDHHTIMHVALVMPETFRICSTTTMRMLPTPGP